MLLLTGKFFLDTLKEYEDSHVALPWPSDEPFIPQEEQFNAQRAASGRKKLVVICHDESTYNANDDQSVIRADDTIQKIKPKGKGSGRKVSDLIDEYNGFLQLTDDEYEIACAAGKGIPKGACKIIAYRETMTDIGLMTNLWHKWKMLFT